MKELPVGPNVECLRSKGRRELHFLFWNMEDKYNLGEVVKMSLLRVDFSERGDRGHGV